MNRSAILWIAMAVVVLGLAVLSVVLGINLMPTRTVATAKGTLSPWIFTWGVIGITVLSAISLAAFLITTAVNKDSRAR